MEMYGSVSWSRFLNKMGKEKTCSGEITLGTVAKISNVEILVVSTLGQEGRVRIRSENSVLLAQIILGHFSTVRVSIMLFSEELVKFVHEEILFDLDEVPAVDSCKIDKDTEMGNLNETDKETGKYNEIYEKMGNCNEIEEETDNYSDRLAIDQSEEIFFLALAHSDNTFPDHVCWNN